MARGRMLDKCISLSEDINDLTLKEAFIYTWIIPHLDDWGRTTGSPRKLKAMIFSMKKEIRISDIQNALEKFKDKNLYFWEEVDGELILQMPPDEFNEHQSITESKRAKSKYPEIPKECQEKPRIPSLSKDKISKENINKDNKTAYAEFVFLSEEEYQKLKDRLGEITTNDWIEELNLYKGSKGKKYASDYMTILSWQRRDPKPITRDYDIQKHPIKKDGEVQKANPEVIKKSINEIKKNLGIDKSDL
jgi:hypothetical protein